MSTSPAANIIAKLRRKGGVGSLRLVSVNTWLIVVNVAIFVLGHMVFNAMIAADLKNGKPGPVANTLMSRVSAGQGFYTDVTEEQQRRGLVDRSVAIPMAKTPNILYHPIYDPKTVRIDSAGRPLVTLEGRPVLREIGFVRFMERPILDAFGHFSTGKAFLELQVWRFITFQFLHVDITHLLFNMLGLWFVGGLVEEYLGRRRYLGFYLLCGLFGGVGYLLLNLLGYVLSRRMPGLAENIPALLFEDIYTPLIGASAGVFGVLMAAAFIAPTAMVDVLFVIPMRLRTAVYAFLGIAVLNLFNRGSNAGGDAAHVGGALAGAYFIRHLHLIRDVLDLWSDSRRQTTQRSTDATMRELDRVLAKARDEGLESLTPAEQVTLKTAAAGLHAPGLSPPASAPGAASR